jgi:F-type H+-transporting ATPase subunit gamma
MTRNIIANKPADVEYKIAVIGDKSRAQLQRTFANLFLFSANEYGRSPPTFEDATAVATQILNSGYKYDGVRSEI